MFITHCLEKVSRDGPIVKIDCGYSEAMGATLGSSERAQERAQGMQAVLPGKDEIQVYLDMCGGVS